MIYTPLTIKEMKIAFQAHINQVDKGGMPYIYHPLHVAEQMGDEHSTCSALLHDVVEDSDITLDYLKAEGFPPEVIDALALLTHDDKVPYLDYIKKISSNPIATKVKIADLEHNIDLSRLGAADDATVEKVKKYKLAYYVLKRAERPAEVIKAKETRCCHAIVPSIISYFCPICEKIIHDPIETELKLSYPYDDIFTDFPIKINTLEKEPGAITRRTDFNYLNGNKTYYLFDENNFPADFLSAKIGEHVRVVLKNINTDHLDEVIFTLTNKSDVEDNCVCIQGTIDDIEDKFEIEFKYSFDNPLESYITVVADADSLFEQT